MIHSQYVAGKEVPPYDPAVSAAIGDYSIEGGGHDMVVGVANLDGEIYRKIGTMGLGPYIHVTNALTTLGMDDLYRNKPGQGGYDSLFIPTDAMLTSADTAQEDHDGDLSPFADVESASATLAELPETDRQAIILSRIGQGEFRAQLISYWGGCAVTGADCIPLLRASHIKPWRSSDNRERLDVYNGLLLTPNLDAAFDSGYVSFDQHGKILLSHAIQGQPAYALHINGKLRINPKLLRPEHQAYLDHHRDHVFLG